MPQRDLPPMARLRAFAALARTGSMSAAGASLNVSHAAISQQVRALEAYLGLRLIRRDGRGVGLTADGARLGETLNHAFGSIAAEIEALTGADADRPLQITTTPMFAAHWLMPRIAGFRREYPDVDLMLNPTPDRIDLTPGGIDLAIRFGGGTWAGVRAELLFHTEFVIVAARDLVGERKVEQPEDLLDFPWLQELGTTEANDWMRSRGVTRARMRGLTQVPGSLLLEGLRSGQGVVAASRSFIEADIVRGDIVVLFEDQNPGVGYFIVTRPQPLRPAAKAFVTWLRRQVRASGAETSGPVGA